MSTSEMATSRASRSWSVFASGVAIGLAMIAIGGASYVISDLVAKERIQEVGDEFDRKLKALEEARKVSINTAVDQILVDIRDVEASVVSTGNEANRYALETQLQLVAIARTGYEVRMVAAYLRGAGADFERAYGRLDERLALNILIFGADGALCDEIDQSPSSEQGGALSPVRAVVLGADPTEQDLPYFFAECQTTSAHGSPQRLYVIGAIAPVLICELLDAIAPFSAPESDVLVEFFARPDFTYFVFLGDAPAEEIRAATDLGVKSNGALTAGDRVSLPRARRVCDDAAEQLAEWDTGAFWDAAKAVER